MKNILPAMQQNWQQISALSLHTDPTIRLPNLRAFQIIDNYCEFLRALTYCKAIAVKEYEVISAETSELIKLKDTLADIREELLDVQIFDDIQIDDEDETSQQQAADALQKTIDEFSKDFRKAIEEISSKIESFRIDLQEFKIVLFGRTKVGKSTVREALTKGDGKTIGKGGQSTTVEINKYTWYNLTVYDTPGILSVKDTQLDQDGIGREERAAYELLEKADIALFMFASDNIEEAELEYLRKICERGRDVLVLLNVKQDVSNYRNFLLRKQDKMISSESQKGHINRIQSAVPESSLKILPIHAQAAFFSRAEKNKIVAKFYDEFKVGKTDLYELSKFSDIRNSLVENIIEQGAAIRCRTIREYFIYQVNTFAKRNAIPIDNCIEITQRILDKINRTKKSVEDKFQRFEASLYDRILMEAKLQVDTHEFATRCIEYEYSKDTIKNKWSELLENELQGIPGRILEEFMKEVEGEIEEMARQIDFQLTQAESFAGYEAYSLPWAGMLKFGGWAAGIIGTAVAIGWLPGGGWVAAGLAALAAVFGWLASLFKSETTKIRELEEKLNSSLRTGVSNIAEQLVSHCESEIKPRIFSMLDKMIASQERLMSIANEFKQLNDCLFQTAKENQVSMEQRLSELGGIK
ncbi:MAG: GTPase domain-containing protein [Lentisphaerae bacterium]|mgnify:CR=1 FL=1|nr:GTPase domain-containing protein [Lentisphaerota bacterium]